MTRQRARKLAVCGVIVSMGLVGLWGTSARRIFVYARSGVAVGCGFGAVIAADGAPMHGWFSTRKPGMAPQNWLPQVAPHRVAIPIWMLLAPVLIPSVVVLWRTRSPAPGHCQTCGYNLTGNVSGVCPECGTEVEYA